MSNRNVALWESPYDLGRLANNGFNFCIAKSVIDSSGNLTFNMVWKSLNLAPRASISWTVQYGLNWTLDVPTGNAQVALGGEWQACNKGEVYDIDSVGVFQPSTVAPKDGYLKVGKNNYVYGGTSGIHILVGVRSPGGDFDPIYVDPTGLAPNMSAWYQPQEKAQWWYEKGVQSASMISGAMGAICPWDFTNPNPKTNTYYVSTTYLYDSGIWQTSLLPPPSVRSTGLMRSPLKLFGSFHDSAVDKIRMDVLDIMEILEKLGQESQSQSQSGFPAEFYLGIVKFATIAYCTHGVKVIVQSLKDKDYEVEYTVDGDKMSAKIKVKTPPKMLQATEFTSGIVPQQVVNDWNAAVKSDAADNPTNGGITSSSNKALNQGPSNDANGPAGNSVDADASAN